MGEMAKFNELWAELYAFAAKKPNIKNDGEAKAAAEDTRRELRQFVERFKRIVEGEAK